MKKLDIPKKNKLNLIETVKPKTRAQAIEHEKKRLELEKKMQEEDNMYKIGDMNDPQVLKGFMRLCGIPFRPWSEL